MTVSVPMRLDVGRAMLAQTQLNIGEQIAFIIEQATTPAGLTGIALGIAGLAYVLLSRRGADFAIVFWFFLLSTLRADYRGFRNALFEPLQTLRDYSRPIALGLAITVAGRLLLNERGDRRQFFVWGMGALLLFQFYYMGMLALFGDPARGGFGTIAMGLSCVALVMGAGRLMQDLDSVRRTIGLLGLAGMLFLGCNLAQLVIGYDDAVLKGRLAGIAGNAQNLAYISVVYLFVSVYMFEQQARHSWMRWAYGLSIGIYAMFIVWAGSRTNAVTCAAGLLFYYRLRIGRFFVIGVLATIVLGVFILFFGESTSNLERFVSGGDTRSGVWARSLSEFRNNPIFGQIPTTASAELDASESGYLRTLSLMGLVGGVLLSVVLAGMAFEILRALRAQKSSPELAPLCNLVVAGFGSLFVVSIGEGFILGIFTLPVLFIYVLYAVSAFIADYPQMDIALSVGTHEADVDAVGAESVA